jgi:hypothetical protein
LGIDRRIGFIKSLQKISKNSWWGAENYQKLDCEDLCSKGGCIDPNCDRGASFLTRSPFSLFFRPSPTPNDRPRDDTDGATQKKRECKRMQLD